MAGAALHPPGVCPRIFIVIPFDLCFAFLMNRITDIREMRMRFSGRGLVGLSGQVAG